MTTTALLDYETVQNYKLDIMVSDETFVTMPERLTIRVNNVNEAPLLWIPTDPVTVSEDITGSVTLFDKIVSDPDGDIMDISVTCVPVLCPFRYSDGGW